MKKTWFNFDFDITRPMLKGLAIGIIIAFVVWLLSSINNKGINSTPVEEKVNIDSITKDSKKLKVEIHKIDSIKNEKIIEVINLDNDSTIKLFRELVAE